MSGAPHLSMLHAALTAPDLPDARSRQFVEGFVRPHGLEAPATPRFVAAVEELLAAPPPPPVAMGAAATACRPVLRLAAPLVIIATSSRSFGDALIRLAVAVCVGIATPAYRLAGHMNGWSPGAAVTSARVGLSKATGGAYKRLRRGARETRSTGRAIAKRVRKRRRQWVEGVAAGARRVSRTTREVAKGTRTVARRAAKAGRKSARGFGRRCVHSAARVARAFVRR